jgi:hypothetical protein
LSDFLNCPHYGIVPILSLGDRPANYDPIRPSFDGLCGSHDPLGILVITMDNRPCRTNRRSVERQNDAKFRTEHFRLFGGRDESVDLRICRDLGEPHDGFLGGTALLIAVQVALDLARKIDAQVSLREY